MYCLTLFGVGYATVQRAQTAERSRPRRFEGTASSGCSCSCDFGEFAAASLMNSSLSFRIISRSFGRELGSDGFRCLSGIMSPTHYATEDPNVGDSISRWVTANSVVSSGGPGGSEDVEGDGS